MSLLPKESLRSDAQEPAPHASHCPRCGAGRCFAAARSSRGTSSRGSTEYLDTSLYVDVRARLPWLVGLMLVQSLSGVIVEIFSSLISDHIVLTAFLTMLVGGGGNASGQTIADLVQRLRTGEESTADSGRPDGCEMCNE